MIWVWFIVLGHIFVLEVHYVVSGMFVPLGGEVFLAVVLVGYRSSWANVFLTRV